MQFTRTGASSHVSRTATATESTRHPARQRAGGGPSVGAVVLAAVAIALVLGNPPALNAQAGNGWIGKRVVQRYSGFRLRIENQVIDPKSIETYRVEQVNGPWLWIRVEGKGLSGWVLADQVVPVEQAIEFFTDYIRTNPGDAYGYTVRARVWLHEKKELDIALGDFNEAIRIDPTEASVYSNRGSIWSAKKEYDKAIADYTEAIRIDPKCVLAYDNRGTAWNAKKEYNRAIADYNEAIRIDPKWANAYFNRGRVWLAKKEYDKAIADFDEAIRIDPKQAFAYVGRGNAWRAKKEYDKAIADYNEGIQINPENAYAYHNMRAWLWATCPDAKYRDGKKSVESATQACELSEWKQAYLIGTLAAAYAEVGDFDAAMKWQSRAIELLVDEKEKDDLRTRLKLYQDKKPYRETTP